METNNGVLACNSLTTSSSTPSEEEMELRRGPWTVEEDDVLIKCIESHGEGRWNSLARCSGLRRTGKSCRLRWLNYLRPDIRRGNITPDEQLLILELHSQFGNRWSKIAQHLPGRTDNEIKNYWRTRVQKHAKQLKCDVNSQKFKDVVRYLWMPRLREQIRAASGSCPFLLPTAPPICLGGQQPGQSPESSSSCSLWARFPSPPVADSYYSLRGSEISGGEQIQGEEYGNNGVVQTQSPGGYSYWRLPDFQQWDMGGNLPNLEDIWF